MFKYLDRQFDKLSKKIKFKVSKSFQRIQNYLKRLLFPIYLFPIKLVTYTTYYVIRFFARLLLSLIQIIVDTVLYPFKSLKNFLKASVILIFLIYMIASLFVIIDYMETNYGSYGKFFCSAGTEAKLKRSVVRIVGGYSEGTGFFISENEVLTNFHVIENEPSPKIIFASGEFITPTRITGDKDKDLAILYVNEKYPTLVLNLSPSINITNNEPLISAGYPFGTDLKGPPTILKGNFINVREGYLTTEYLQTDITLVNGMSGGPITDKCGTVFGVNTLGVSGMSFFISSRFVNSAMAGFTDQDVKKIDVDPTKSPEDAVRAFYTYLKARRMQDGFNLLSSEYLKNTDFQEWTNRFTDILDVRIYKSEKYQNTTDTAFVKFSTKNWVDGDARSHYYEGTWVTVWEDGKYKMLEADIVEVSKPEWTWFYD